MLGCLPQAIVLLNVRFEDQGKIRKMVCSKLLCSKDGMFEITRILLCSKDGMFESLQCFGTPRSYDLQPQT